MGFWVGMGLGLGIGSEDAVKQSEDAVKAEDTIEDEKVSPPHLGLKSIRNICSNSNSPPSWSMIEIVSGKLICVKNDRADNLKNVPHVYCYMKIKFSAVDIEKLGHSAWKTFSRPYSRLRGAEEKREPGMDGQKQKPLFNHVETTRGVGQADLPMGVEKRHDQLVCLQFTSFRMVTTQKAKAQCLLNDHVLTDTLVNKCSLHFAEFHGLEEWMLLRALQALHAEGKAEIITLDDGKGVKFF
ncbi:Vacuolar protein-sorting-associated protein 25 [Bagarius yarrelli]|uniref:Vacuolar protein-sorting-associated protein 25 n=1 Tax=Bagarius yarrelli TaxID=175774 RepID=A0A556U114_BAGYA|nr:Vacuolar protein-sorting-associated protein 25 [Bagarius yarrelli]